MTQQITRQLDEAGLYFGRERELLETVASLARATPDGVLVWRGTNAQLAEALSCSERTLARVWSAVRALALHWLEIHTMKSIGLLVYIAPATNSQQAANKLPSNGQQAANHLPTSCQVTANNLPSNGQQPATRARVPCSKILPTEELGRQATREATSGVVRPASQPVLTEEGLAGWLHSELTRRAAQLVQHPDHQPDPAALESAAQSLTASLGSEDTARRYCDARLLAYELRTLDKRPGTMARLIGWLLQDSARADLRTAAEGASDTAPARPTSQSYVSEGFDDDLEAAIAHGTRNAEADSTADAAWEAHLYREQCEAAFKEAKHFGDVPAGTPYSDEAMTRYGLWPERPAKKEALR
jgi:hypothetical protein